MDCSFCRYTGPTHNPNCPEVGTDSERRLKRASYHLGWEYGRLGMDSGGMERFFSIGHPGAWALGEGNGISALEEAENGGFSDDD